MPGDAGVPPQFDWSRSRNVKSRHRAAGRRPARFIDEGGETVGYKDRVVFPLDVVAEDAGQPIHLALDRLSRCLRDRLHAGELDLSLDSVAGDTGRCRPH